MSQYSGADWIKSNILDGGKMSPLGEAVANLLGDLFFGIYHLDSKALHRVDWANNHHIIFSLGWRCLSTYDYDELTVLVVLSHDRAIRVQIEAATHKFLRLMFHQRECGEDPSTQAPTLEGHIARIRQHYSSS
jgi:hypothetical protein